MSGKSLVDQIRHYQKDIERCPENSERMIRCIQRLYVLPIQVLHLQETGVGRSVNSLRKYKGEVGEAAKALVAKWKAMVAAEESSDDSNDKIKSNAGDYKLSKSSISPVKVEPKYEKPVVKVEPKAEKPIVKTEPKAEKQDHSSSRDKYCSKDRSSTRDNLNSKEKSTSKSHHSLSRHHSETHSSSRSHSSSMKRSHSSSEKNHTSDRKSSSHQNHKSSHNEKRHTSDEETPPSPKKHKKHHSHSRNHSHSKEETVESEEEADEEEANESNDDRSEAGDSSSDSEKESSEESDNSSVEEELTDRLATLEEEEEEEQESDNSSSDHRHRSKHKSSYHKHVKSSHSDKNKENRNSHKSSTRDSSKTSKDSKSSKHLDELIKENEKKIKKEKEDFEVPKYIPTKIVKLERNEDGSIDSGSGASFADALLGMDSFAEPKKKKKCSSKEPSSNSNHKTSSSSKSSSSSSSHKKQHSQSSSSSSKDKLKEMSSKPKSIDELVETPDLLTKKVKLEALDLDISSTLPEINPNYKPLPHVPESSRRQSKMSEEDTMFSIMTTKNQRTKVYSGNKVYQNTVPSLFNLCIQLLYENIDAVEYTGGVPYNLLKPLLERLNSDQLYVIEHFNPYLIEDTDNLWKFHCSKDFRSQKRQDMESWRDLYLRCIEERERKLKAVTANISHSMAKSTPVRQAKLAYVDSVVKPPRNVARKQAKYGTGSGSSSSSKSTPNNNKQDIVNKAIVGGHTPGVSAKDVVPPPPAPRAVHHSTPAVLKKKKAPLMQKALQFIKGNRYKR